MNGLGFAVLILTAFIGIPAAYYFDAKKKPGVSAPGQNKR